MYQPEGLTGGLGKRATVLDRLCLDPVWKRQTGSILLGHLFQQDLHPL